MANQCTRPAPDHVGSDRWDHWMRTLLRTFVLGTMLGSALLLSEAVYAAPATAITATNSVIDFGSFSVLPSCVNCSITVSPAGVRTASAGIVLTSAKPGRASTYSVSESGCSCKAYTAAVTPASVAATMGGVQMTLDTFTFAQSGTLPPNVLSVGAKLTIASSASAGIYSGWSFTVTTTP